MRILVLSYYFPPIGGGGAQRPFRLVQHLRERGFEAVVVTGTGPTLDRWAPEDGDLSREVPGDLEIHRVPAPEPVAGGTPGRLERFLGIPQPWSRWWADGLAREGVAHGRACDLIWAVMQPYQSARPAAQLAAKLGIPWVADLADPWALDEMILYPTALHRWLTARRMRSVLSRADGIVMSTPEAASRLTNAFPELKAHLVGVGPHGWERADFAAPVPKRVDSKFRIVHTGSLHTQLGTRQEQTARLRRVVGGDRDNVKILTRSHVYLLEALDGLLRERPEWRDLIEVHLAGVQDDMDQQVAANNPAVHLLGYLGHADSLALLRSADLLFLPMHNLPPGVRAGLVPGKTYEYIAVGRPILAAVPDGDARDILSAAGSALVCRPDDVTAMRTILAEQVTRFLAGAPPPEPVPAVAERFEYDQLAAEIGEFFADVLARWNRSSHRSVADPDRIARPMS